MNIYAGDCSWSTPHPPHLWAEDRTYPDGGAAVLTFACSGTAEEED